VAGELERGAAMRVMPSPRPCCRRRWRGTGWWLRASRGGRAVGAAARS